MEVAQSHPLIVSVSFPLPTRLPPSSPRPRGSTAQNVQALARDQPLFRSEIALSKLILAWHPSAAYIHLSPNAGDRMQIGRTPDPSRARRAADPGPGGWQSKTRGQRSWTMP